jgi:hypothetical protein
MGIYYSEDGRYCTSTLDYPPSTFLTPKGIKDRNDAAIIIQKWWKRIKPQNDNNNNNYSDNESYMADVDSNDESYIVDHKEKIPINNNVSYLVGITGITIGIITYLLH